MPTFPKMRRIGLRDVDEALLAAEVAATADRYDAFARRLTRERKMKPKEARAYVERCIAAMFDAIGSEYQGRLGPLLARIVENRHQVEQIYVGIIKLLEEKPKLRLDQLPPELQLSRLEGLLDQIDKDLAAVEGHSPAVELVATKPTVDPTQIVADANKAFLPAEVEKLVPKGPEDFPKGAATPAPKEWTTEGIVGGASDPHLEKTGTRVPTGKTIEGEQLTKAQREKIPRTQVFSPEDFRMGIDDLAVHPDDAKLPQPQLATVARLKRVVGKKISEIPELLECWEPPPPGTPRRQPPQSALERVEALWDSKGRRRTPDQVGRQGMLDAYALAQQHFWNDVRKHPAAKAYLEAAGIGGLEAGDTGAAFARTKSRPKERPQLSDKQTRLSLDHNRRKATPGNWRHALDPKELTFEFDNPNSLKESIQQAFGIEDHSAPKDIHEQLRQGTPVRFH